MTRHIFKDAPAHGDSALAAKAWDYWQNYGDLRRKECWRWTPLTALETSAPRFAATDYQVSAPEPLQERLARADDDARWLDFPDLPFAALNLALLGETLQITVPENFHNTEVLAINIDQIRAGRQFSRLAIVLGARAKVSLWLDLRAETQSAQLPALHLVAGEESECDAVLWFAGATESAQLGAVLIEAAAAAQVRLNAVQAGGDLARLDVRCQLVGEGASFDFGGVQCLKGQQIADYHLHVRHQAENCRSHQVVRGALDDEAFGIFDGMVYVAPGAQKTDAKQDSRFVLQSATAKSQSAPRLEIYADDVKCAHGSTVGCIDPEALFYLQSRGIGREDAKKMLILSFLHEAVVVTADNVAPALHDAITALWTEEDQHE